MLFWRNNGLEKKKDIIESLDNNKDFKELRMEELYKGYIQQENGQGYTCIFCGEYFEEGVIYTSRERMVTAEKATIEHIEDEHGGIFKSLISLDKHISGLSDIQKSMLVAMFSRKDVKVIGEEMGISPATVRAHKFNLQKMKREAKIFLTLMEVIETNNSLNNQCNIAIDERDNPELINPTGDEVFSLNLLHPFFTQCRYK